MSRRLRRARVGLVLGVVLSVAAVGAGASIASGGTNPPDVPENSWVATWATATKTPTPIFDAPVPEIADTTLRQIVRVSAGGWAARVWLTNEFGTEPLEVGEARIAVRRGGSKIEPGTDRPLTFAGRSAVTIPAGQRIASDPVRLRVRNRAELAISLYFPDDVTASGSPVSFHVRALQTNYLADGNQTAKRYVAPTATVPSWFFLDGVDVASPSTMPVIAAIGDSIIDGDQVASSEPIDDNDRFTDFLSERILWGAGGAAERIDGAVVNLGISGNQVTSTLIGQSVADRFADDVLGLSGVSHVIVQGGINDIGLPGLLNTFGIAGFFGPNPRPEIPAADIIAGLERVASEARAAGLVVVGATLSPSSTSGLPGYVEPDSEAKRLVVNEWIRTTDSFDHVADFDAVLRDPSDPSVLRPSLSADGLHPNADGYAAMAAEAYGVIFDRR